MGLIFFCCVASSPHKDTMTTLARRREAPGGRSEAPQNDISEAENDAILAELLKDVRALKGSSMEVGGEVREHLTLADRLQDVLLHANDRVKKAIRGVEGISGVTASSHIWLVIAFAFVVFFFIYILIKTS
jgi:hypothetical protein